MAPAVKQLNKKGGANRWKFQSFAERIKDIHIDIASETLGIQHVHTDENDSHFNSTLQKYNELNGTADFGAFSQEVHRYSGSLSLMLHHKKKVVQIILKHLEKPDSQAAESILPLLTMLAKDLRNEFEEFLPVVINAIVPFMRRLNDPPLIEASFQCLASLLKYLQKYVLREIRTIYDLLSPLLGRGQPKLKPYVQQFAAEALSYMIRKLYGDKLMQFIRHVLESILHEVQENQKGKKEPSSKATSHTEGLYVEGVALFLSCTLKHVNRSLHSCAQEWLSMLMQSALQLASSQITHGGDALDLVMQKMLVGLVAHITLDNNKKEDSRGANLLLECFREHFHVNPEKVSKFFRPCIQFQRGAKLACFASSFLQPFHAMSTSACRQLSQEAMQLYAHLLSNAGSNDIVPCRRFLDQCGFGDPSWEGFPAHLVFAFHQTLMESNFEGYASCVLPWTFHYIQERCPSYLSWDVLAFLSSLFNPPNAGSRDPSARPPASGIPFRTPPAWLLKGPLAVSLLEGLESYTPQSNPTQRLQALALLSLSPYFSAPKERRVACLYRILEQCTMERFLWSRALILAASACETDEEHENLEDLVSSSFSSSSSSPFLLECPYLLQALSKHITGKASWAPETKQRWAALLSPLMGSFYHAIRKPVLECLSHLFPGIKALPLCLDIESTENSVASIRKKGVLLKQLSSALAALHQNSNNSGSSHSVNEAGPAVLSWVCHYLMALFSVNFSVLWNLTRDILVGIASTHPEIFWECIYGRLLQYQNPASFIKAEFDIGHLLLITSDSDLCSLVEANGDDGQVLLNQLSRIWGMESERIDYTNVYLLLLQTLRGLNITERKTKQLVPLFFLFLQTQYARHHPGLFNTLPATPSIPLCVPSQHAHPNPQAVFFWRRSVIEDIMRHFLELFKGLQPPSVYLADTLYTLYLDLLDSHDTRLQRSALECILTYSHEWYRPYHDLLIQLLEDRSIRDALLALKLQGDPSPTIQKAHRDNIMPFLLRLLYGRFRSSRGSNIESRRANILMFIGGCSAEHIQLFFDSMLPLKSLLPETMDVHVLSVVKYKRAIQFCQLLQLVLKHLHLKIHCVLPKLMTLLTSLACSVQCRIENARTRRENTGDVGKERVDEDEEEVGEVEEVEDDDDDDDGGGNTPADEDREKTSPSAHRDTTKSQSRTFFDEESEASFMEVDGLSSSSVPPTLSALDPRLKKLRLLVLHRLLQVFRMGIPIDGASVYIEHLFQSLVVPKLPQLAQDNKNRATPTFLLLASWFQYHMTHLRPHVPQLMDPLLECLVSEPLRKWILDMLCAVREDQVDVFRAFGSAFLRRAVHILSPRTVTFDMRLFQLCKDAALAMTHEDAPLVSNMVISVLKSRASPAIKTSCLDILKPCIPHLGPDMVRSVFEFVSRLFGVLDDRYVRTDLASMVTDLSGRLCLPMAASLCLGLNKLSSERLDELDYDVVIASFSEVLEYPSQLQPDEWIPLLYNCIFYIQESDMSLRNFASRSLSIFIQAAAENEALRCMVRTIVYPAIKHSLQANPSETVRAEYLKVLRACIEHLPNHDHFANLRVLLPKEKGDDSSFLENIYHIQLHRRTRAVMRLREHIKTISVPNLKNIVLPLIMHMLDHPDTNLVSEAILALTQVALRLPWNSYYSMLRRFFVKLKVSETRSKTKQLTKMILAWIHGFHFNLNREPDAMEIDGVTSSSTEVLHPHLASYPSNGSLRTPSISCTFPPPSSTKEELVDEIPVAPPAVEEAGGILSKGEDTEVNLETVDDDDDDDDDDENNNHNGELQEFVSTEVSGVKSTLPSEHSTAFSNGFRDPLNSYSLQDIELAILNNLIPELYKYFIHQKKEDDPATKSIRVPIALGITRLITFLPPKKQSFHIPKLLTNLCQMLRSRSKIARHKVRATMVDIMQVLGSKYLYFLLKELASSLTRGYQLHVIGYTVHKIMKAVDLTTGDLEGCGDDLCAIIQNDIFGSVGKEKDEEAYIKKMVEMKQCKSYEIVHLMAKKGSCEIITKLLVIIKRVLIAEPDASVLNKVSRLLSKISFGFLTNENITLEELLKVAHSLILDNISLELSETRTPWKKQCHYFTEFGLRIFRGCLRSQHLQMASEVHASMLHSLLEVTAQVFSSHHHTSIMFASKTTALLVHMRLPKIGPTMALIMKDTFHLLSNSQDYHSELSRTLMHLIATTLRDCHSVPFTSSQIKSLLQIIRPELDDHRHQTVHFSIIQSILQRKLVISEVYDVMLEISHIMVKSHSTNVQQLCRSAYIQFLLEYPQGQQRLDNHFSWIVKNLSYEHEKGRNCLLELLHSLLTKLPKDVISAYGEMLVAGLASRLTDESPKCREMSGAVLQLLIGLMPELRKIHHMLRAWYKWPETTSVACQIHGILVFIGKDDPDMMAIVIELLNAQPINGAGEAKQADSTSGDFDNSEQWKVLYFAIVTFTKFIIRNGPRDYNVMQLLASHYLHPHHWIRMASSRCLNAFLSTPACVTDQNIRSNTIAALLKQLQSEYLDEELASLVIKNLFFLLTRFNQETENQTPDFLLRTVRRLSYMARVDQSRNRGTLFRESIFKIFASLMDGLDASTLGSISGFMLAPIHRTLMDRARRGTAWVALRGLCQDVFQLLEAKLGPTEFGKVYSKVRGSAETIRHARKQQFSELAVTNPSLHSKYLLARRANKKRHRKRKIEEEMASRVHLTVKRLRKT